VKFPPAHAKFSAKCLRTKCWLAVWGFPILRDSGRPRGAGIFDIWSLCQGLSPVRCWPSDCSWGKWWSLAISLRAHLKIDPAPLQGQQSSSSLGRELERSAFIYWYCLMIWAEHWLLAQAGDDLDGLITTKAISEFARPDDG